MYTFDSPTIGCNMRIAIVLLSSLVVGSESFIPAGKQNTKFSFKEPLKEWLGQGPDGSKKRKCLRCPETTREDTDLDRREALFAMVGTLWASTSTFPPGPANALYGADAKIELPNIVDGMTQRVNQQCLVESLGNRECLVYMDPANKLYQGADSRIMLQRIETASEALATIPSLVESKKWSQINGVLTGPLGTLLSTMSQLAAMSENGASASEIAKKTKIDIFAIDAATGRKQGDATLKAHKDATESLVSFIKML